ncbi:MAG: 4-(cytidine 5'-diphospho)-2-C-methyl-D-erythritol kinase [Denitrovibrio sp.]|mgnify:CR=1 FL=1|nr:MAG: 4-(cytidine 5'-diphospho)-2-C-methyl-D-erythritol kinase [Denitrovibrio sp.]
MKKISLKSYGKINIFLHILGKRQDGFHDIFTLFTKISLYDTLNITMSDTQKIICDKASIPLDESNIINRVQRILESDYGVKERFTTELIKRIPDGGGLGGGSSNAAAYLNGVLELLDMQMDMKTKTDIMARVGSDTAFFLHDEPMIGEGRGERLTPFGRLPECFLLLINPGIHIPTGRVFSSGNLKLTESTELNRMRHTSEYTELGNMLFNGLEETVFDMYPVVKKAKETLLEAGSDFALMSGSGATVFGIFPSENSAFRARDIINKKYPEWSLYQACLVN